MVTDFIQPVSGSRKDLAAVGCVTNGKLLYPKHAWGSSHLSPTGTRQIHSEMMTSIKGSSRDGQSQCSWYMPCFFRRELVGQGVQASHLSSVLCLCPTPFLSIPAQVIPSDLSLHSGSSGCIFCVTAGFFFNIIFLLTESFTSWTLITLTSQASRVCSPAQFWWPPSHKKKKKNKTKSSPICVAHQLTGAWSSSW